MKWDRDADDDLIDEDEKLGFDNMRKVTGILTLLCCTRAETRTFPGSKRLLGLGIQCR